jgi:hypothetical protein
MPDGQIPKAFYGVANLSKLEMASSNISRLRRFRDRPFTLSLDGNRITVVEPGVFSGRRLVTFLSMFSNPSRCTAVFGNDDTSQVFCTCASGLQGTGSDYCAVACPAPPIPLDCVPAGVVGADCAVADCPNNRQGAPAVCRDNLTWGIPEITCLTDLKTTTTTTLPTFSTTTTMSRATTTPLASAVESGSAVTIAAVASAVAAVVCCGLVLCVLWRRRRRGQDSNANSKFAQELQRLLPDKVHQSSLNEHS